MTDFWTLAWSIEHQLDTRSPSDPESVDALLELRGNLALQQFLFVHRAWCRPEWLSAFVDNGLFENPPIVGQVDGRLVARAWPVMRYLSEVAPEAPGEVADMLASLRTANWWVINDGLDAASRLPAELASQPILNLLSEWQASPSGWSDPQALSRVLAKLADATVDPALLAVATARVLDRLWRDTNQWYELEEVLSSLSSANAAVRYRFADGIELTLLGRLGGRAYRSVGFAPQLDDVDPDTSDPVQLLARRWLALIDDEWDTLGPDATYARASRLMAVGDGLIRQMGLRALRKVLDGRPHDRLAVQQLEKVALDPDTLTTEAEISELVTLFRSHFGSLAAETQVALMERAYALATHEEKLSRYYGRDWLSALMAFIGPRERLALRVVEAELGPARSKFETHHSVAGFVPLRGPLGDADVAALTPGELLALMRNVPRRGDDVFDTSVEAIAAQAKTQVAQRPDDFIELLPAIAADVPYATVMHHVVWGLSDAFKDNKYQTPDRLEALLGFLSSISSRASSGGFEAESIGMHAGRSVHRAVADLLEDHAPWILTTKDVRTVRVILTELLDSDDPTPDHEVRFGGSNMDPPTLALNTVRGRATRALSRLLADASAPGDAAQPFVAELSELARVRARIEASPSVKSSFGIYLPWFLTRLPELWNEMAVEVLPIERDTPTWEAVFTTYVMFNNANRRVAETLRSHYKVSIERLDDQHPFLLAHTDRVLHHLIALSLPEAVSDDWFGLLVTALEAADPTSVALAARSLAHSLRRDPELVPRDWAVRLVRNRLSSINGHRNRRPEEATGLLDLMLATRAAPVEVGGEVLGLMHAGAAPPDWSVIEYLIDCDEPRTAIGVEILSRAIGDAAFRGYVRDVAAFEALLADYATIAPGPTWRLVNQLGATGEYRVEGVAKSLAATAT